jgi:hypothetical protein
MIRMRIRRRRKAEEENINTLDSLVALSSPLADLIPAV